MRAIFNGPVGRTLIIILCIGVHILFALGMYFLGTFLGSLVLRDIPGGAHIFGILLAVVMFISAMIVFVYHEYTKEDIDAYERMAKRQGQIMPAFTESQKIVAALEVSSLLYRCFLTWVSGSPFGAAITFLIGILLLRFAYNLGKIIHAQTNKPASLEMQRAREWAGREVVNIGYKQKKKLGIQGLARLWKGDPSSLQQPLDADEQARLDAERSARERERSAQNTFDENQKFTQDFMKGLTPQPSQNGHAPQPLNP